MHTIRARDWKMWTFDDYFKKWLLLLFGLVDYSAAPHTSLQLFTQKDIVTTQYRKYIIDEVGM